MTPRFLTVAQVIAIQQREIEAFGGTHGIRSREGLESAVATPQATFGGEYLHPDLWSQAAAYAFHIAEAQAFLDGNKRAALASALTFLAHNGFEFDDPEDRLYEAMIQIATHELDKAGLAAVFRTLAEGTS